jgi:four helix bundle protein
MSTENLKIRTKQFALGIIKLVENIPGSSTGDILGPSLLQAGTSVAAHYRAACRAKTQTEFVAKLDAVEDEIDASIFLMEVLLESGKVPADAARPLLTEAGELLNITVAAAKTAFKDSNQGSASALPPLRTQQGPR